MAVAPEKPRIYEGSRIPSPIPTVLQIPPDRRGSEDLLQVNFGPNHPSTHGVLRLIVDLHGEDVVGLSAVIGYLHTGFEKNMEAKTWWKAITYPERIDYLSFQNNELVFVLAIEKLLGLEVPEKATWMRMCLAELNRIHSHLVWLATRSRWASPGRCCAARGSTGTCGATSPTSRTTRWTSACPSTRTAMSGTGTR